MFTLTPTWFTQESTTSSRLFLSPVCETSCWYCPTPMLLGSIFTSSASGSCSRRAIEMAPRTVTSRSGNSSRAASLALYTLAPASLTITTGTSSWKWRSASRTNDSVSRPAVPFPTATARMPAFFTSSARRGAACALPPGDSRCMSPEPTYRPLASTTASLQPVRSPGSTPSTALGP